jgi:hypothetical protein
MTHVPAYDDARVDSELIGHPLSVYLYLLHDYLTPVDWRPLKHEALAARCKCSTDTIARTLKVLVELRYIERTWARPGEVRTYRLVYTRMP